MISFFEASLAELSIHRIGNKSEDEFYVLSEKSIAIRDITLSNLLQQYFLSPYEKVNEVYRFIHPNGDLNLNETYHFATEIFANGETFHENSKQLAKYLYDVSGHPKIKSGELYVAYFENVQIEGELHDAIGIFKSETKESYLKVFPEQDGFGLSYEQEAININKLDKGCLIFNTDKEEGFKVAVIDQRSAEAVYWKDEFLKLKIRNDSYNQTAGVLGVYKNFVTEKLDQEFDISKADKIDLLNKSMKYFKEKESFDIEEFSNEVIGNAEGIESFKTYKKNFEEEFDQPIPDSFDISGAAVKKQARAYKSVLKLDKNFHIYIHGDKELIEKGFDDDKSMNYYKVFFKDEE
ncbi:nucleoid-associated protein [Pedobacter hiemivivus]|uniref:Nucleoid-associated protein n=1 Tax=Pedobacter hiemivivus TaxID=2530454 RepID=A0A4U1G324_9SPHI|nr:nucleoid-associated protein [Pedobacter hiemivivus]TCC86273.1 nucleoid-associated protein [Pedobacter hiemivivus]TKC58001.1 nucleoid-associated protein [Pedobacter hiemivivus]